MEFGRIYNKLERFRHEKKRLSLQKADRFKHEFCRSVNKPKASFPLAKLMGFGWRKKNTLCTKRRKFTTKRSATKSLTLIAISAKVKRTLEHNFASWDKHDEKECLEIQSSWNILLTTEIFGKRGAFLQMLLGHCN